MPLILNVGCGESKIKDAINLDCDPAVKPDIIFDIRKQQLPYERDTVDEILFFHTIEHIEKKHRLGILCEFYRVLKPDGRLIMSYPEFSKVVQNWLNNKMGMREFWEATIYGRQASVSDYHVSVVDSTDLKDDLKLVGFYKSQIKSEPHAEYNSICETFKGTPIIHRQEILAEEIFGQ